MKKFVFLSLLGNGVANFIVGSTLCLSSYAYMGCPGVGYVLLIGVLLGVSLLIGHLCITLTAAQAQHDAWDHQELSRHPLIGQDIQRALQLHRMSLQALV